MENTEALMDTTLENAEVTNDTTAEAEQTEAESIPNETAEESEAEAPTAAEEPFLVRFNHEERELTRDEAVQYAQKGLKLDAVTPTLEKLSYLAAAQGKGASEWLDGLIKEREDAYRAELEEKYEDAEVIELFMAKYKTENEDKYAKFKSDKAQAEEAERKTLESRIADEFIELQKEFPEITDIAKLPKEVLAQGQNGKNLTDAYLRYKHNENKRINAEKQSAARNANASAGKISGEDSEADPLFTAFLSGLRKT